MIRAELKYIHSPDVNFETYYPEDPKCFGFLLQAFIGPVGEEGGEMFSLDVSTLSWIEARRDENAYPKIMFGRGFLIVSEYDISEISSYISALCDRCSGENWQEVATKLAKFAEWEFEDYH
jgi:hypothetical protein